MVSRYLLMVFLEGSSPLEKHFSFVVKQSRPEFWFLIERIAFARWKGQRRLREAYYAWWGIPTNSGKSLERASKAERLGPSLTGKRTLKTRTRRSLDLFGVGSWVRARTLVPKKALPVYAGKAIHILQFRRCLFSVMEVIFTLIARGGEMVPVSDRLCEEMLPFWSRCSRWPNSTPGRGSMEWSRAVMPLSTAVACATHLAWAGLVEKKLRGLPLRADSTMISQLRRKEKWLARRCWCSTFWRASEVWKWLWKMLGWKCAMQSWLRKIRTADGCCVGNIRARIFAATSPSSMRGSCGRQWRRSLAWPELWSVVVAHARGWADSPAREATLKMSAVLCSMRPSGSWRWLTTMWPSRSDSGW